MSWLKFNERVLEEACAPNTPLLEQLKYLSITVSNLDEFFMVRVARLKQRIKRGDFSKDKAGYNSVELFGKIAQTIHEMKSQIYQKFLQIIPRLAAEGIIIKTEYNINEEQFRYAKSYFKKIVFPVLTPLAIDQSRPLPLIANRSLHLGLCLESGNKKDLFPYKHGKNLISIVEVPPNLPRVLNVPSENGKKVFVFLEDIIKENIELLFTGYKVKSTAVFRITRNADVNLDESARNLLLEMERYVKRREKGFPVRLETGKNIPAKLYNFLARRLNLSDIDIYKVNGPVDLTGLKKIYDQLDNFQHLKFTPVEPRVPKEFCKSENIFQVIKEKDILLHHPYQSFAPVVELVKNAADDNNVLAIKQTLYRVSGDSPIIRALARAAKKGKQVTVIVELKARFDEKQNIEWAKRLEEAGCHVIYGLVGYKVHAKLLLIVRSEDSGIKRYVHISSGNYNDRTARLYTDVGLFTAKQVFGSDISDFFNLLTGFSAPPQWKKISVAPLNLRDKFIQLIEKEIEHVEEGKSGHIMAKMNALVDKEIIKKLYQASHRGVKIDLIVRGICCLKPGVEGLSKNIRVVSIVGKLLEHSRIYYFYNGSREKVFLTSADWRPRNLDRRVEVLFPVEQEDIKQRLKNILEVCLQDNIKGRKLKADGNYKLNEGFGDKKVEAQQQFMKKVQKKKASDELFVTL